MTRILGTADIPQAYWKDARLIGRTPFLACQLDSRISYCLYIPQQYGTGTIPLIVNVHGSLRRAEKYREVLIPLADRCGAAVLAPLFPAGLGDPNDMHGYKLLSSNGIRFDLALLAILDEVKSRWPNIDTDKIHLAGYSGGGQFVSRFSYLYPERLASVSIGAPGTCTRPDTTSTWPVGIKGTEQHFDRSVNIGELKKVKIQLLVGANDTVDINMDLLKMMRPNASLPDRLPTRLQALTDLHKEFEALHIDSELCIVDDAAHNYDLVVPSVIAWLERSLSPLAQQRYC